MRKKVVRHIHGSISIIITRKGKIFWKLGPYCWDFWLNLKFLGWPYRTYIKTAKIATFAREKRFSHFLLLWPRRQGFCGTLEDRYRSKRVSQMLLVCYNLLSSENIPSYLSINKQWKMVGYRDASDIAKKAAKVAQKKEQWLVHGESYP